MQITKYNPYTPAQEIVLEASKGKKLKELKTSQYIDVIKEAIIKALICIGQKQDSNQIKIIADGLCYELKVNFKFLAIEEVCIAIDFGVKNKLTEITKLPQPVVSITNLLTFIRLYNNTVRRDALAKEREEEDKKEKEISEIERQAKIKAFDEEVERSLSLSAQEKKELPIGLRATYYRHLDKTGRVNLSVEEKKIIYKKAEILIKSKKIKDYFATRNPFLDQIFEQKKKNAQIIELSQALAFELLQ